MSYTNRSMSTSRVSDHKDVLVLSIVEPVNTKRYQLRISGKLSKLTVGKLKESLRSGSSCDIPVPWMRLEYKSFVLSNDNQRLCSVLNLNKDEVLLHVYDNRVSEQYNTERWQRSNDNNNNLSRKENSVNIIRENYKQRTSRKSTSQEYKSQSHKSSLLVSPVELNESDCTRYTSVNNRNCEENSLNNVNEINVSESSIPSVLLPQTSPVRNRLHKSHRTVDNSHNVPHSLSTYHSTSQKEKEKQRKQTLPFRHDNYVNGNHSYSITDSTTSPLTFTPTSTTTTPLRRHSYHLFTTQTGKRGNSTPTDNNKRSINTLEDAYYSKNGVKNERSFIHNVSSSSLPLSQESLSATCNSPPVRHKQITIIDNTFYDAWENAQEHVQRLRISLDLCHDKTELRWHVTSSSAELPTLSELSHASSLHSHFVATCTLHLYYMYKWHELQNGKESKLYNALRKSSPEQSFSVNRQCKDREEAEKTKQIIMTYDSQTERLYLYATLQTFELKEWQRYSMSAQLELFEFLLQASLLGRNVCGGAMSIERCKYNKQSNKNFVKITNLDSIEEVEMMCILLSTSLYMPTSQPWSLLTILPHFVNTLQYWEKEINVFLPQLDTINNNNYINNHHKESMKVVNACYSTSSSTSSSSPPMPAHFEPVNTTPRKSFLLFNYNKNKQQKEKEEHHQNHYKRLEKMLLIKRVQLYH